MNKKSSYFKFGIGFLTLIILGLAFNYFWQTNFSPVARANRQMEEQYKKYQEFINNYQKAMTADTYGGKTPQETLDLFVAALEKGDIELASKYFFLKENGERDEKWKEALIKTKAERGFDATIDLFKRAKPDVSLWEGDFRFKIFGESGETEAMINLELNKYSNVWKIESL